MCSHTDMDQRENYTARLSATICYRRSGTVAVANPAHGGLAFGVVEEPSENVRVVFHVGGRELDAPLELRPPGMGAQALPEKVNQRCSRDAWIFVRDLCHDG